MKRDELGRIRASSKFVRAAHPSLVVNGRGLLYDAFSILLFFHPGSSSSSRFIL